MKLFSCQACGQLLYFENVRARHCGRALGYLPDLTEISALDPIEGGGWTALAAPGKAYKFCHNYDAGMCNWMLPADDDEGFCAACRHNHVIPDLSVPGNDALWAQDRDRQAPAVLFPAAPAACRWKIAPTIPSMAWLSIFWPIRRRAHAAGVMTGHDNGLITLAVREADDAVREKVRGEMGEPYRTLLGHFRHESGHYFWDRLVAGRSGAARSLPRLVRRRARRLCRGAAKAL